MIKWLVKIATSPVQIIDGLYPDRSQWDVNIYLVRMYYHELEKLRPGIWDRVWQASQDNKETYTTIYTTQEALTEALRNDFEKKLRDEMESIYEDTRLEYEKRLAVPINLIQKNWNRLQDRYDTPESALESINNQKRDGLYEWMNELNDAEYEPAFKYVVLQQLVKKYGKDKMMPPPEVDAEILAKVSELVYTGHGMKEDGNPVNFWDLWQSATLSVQSAESFVGGKGWIRYPKNSNPNKLRSAIQGSGWCIATQHYAESYLSRGDVYIYFDGKAQVAMHVEPYRDNREGYATEIFERFNAPVSTYAAEVIEYTNSHGITIDEQTAGYEGLQQAIEINRKLDTDPSYAANFVQEIYKDSYLFKFLSKEKKKVPAYRKAYTDAVLKDLQYCSNCNSMSHILNEADNDIIQENEEAFMDMMRFAFRQTESWFDAFQLLHNEDAHRLIRKLIKEPEFLVKIKKLYLDRKKQEKYHTMGQGRDDRSDTVGQWLKDDPEFYNALRDILIERIGHTKDKGGMVPQEAAFMLTENNSIIIQDPEVEKTLRDRTLHYISNNPDQTMHVKMALKQLHNQNNDFRLPLDDDWYNSVLHNVNNWLWLFSPNHPRNSGKDYWTVGLNVGYADLYESALVKELIHFQGNRSSNPFLLMSHPNWPVEEKMPISYVCGTVPQELISDPRIQERVAALVVPVWDRSINTTLQPPDANQPYNPYDPKNKDILKSGSRYLEMSLVALFYKHPEIQRCIQEHYRNPQFLYSAVRNMNAHLDTESLEDAVSKISIQNNPIPNDPEILEAIQTFRKEEAKQYLNKVSGSGYSHHGGYGYAAGIDIHQLMLDQKMPIPKDQEIRERRYESFNNLAVDLQNDPEIQKYFDDRLQNELLALLQTSAGKGYGRIPLRDLHYIPRHMWQKEQFKEHEKAAWIRSLNEGQLNNMSVHQAKDAKQWYPNVCVSLWKSIPDHLKADPEIQEAFEGVLSTIMSRSNAYHMVVMQTAKDILHAAYLHKELMPSGSTFESNNWMITPFRNTLKSRLDDYAIEAFLISTEIAAESRNKLLQEGYDSPFMQELVEITQRAKEAWSEVGPDVKRLKEEERTFSEEWARQDRAKRQQQQQQQQQQQDEQLLRQLGQPVQASSWLLKAVESHITKVFGRSVVA